MLSPTDLARLRAVWRGLCARPDREELRRELRTAFVADLVVHHATLAQRPADSRTRAKALGGLLRAALVLDHLAELLPWTEGPFLQELRARWNGEAEATESPGPSAVTPLRDDDPFLPWALGELAERADEPEREALVDRAIAAFDAIADAPTGPGNDAGPFHRLAPLMTDAQVHRALAVLTRMKASSWGTDLAYGRAALATRLAALGAIDEADAQIDGIELGDQRARCRGVVLGERLARGEGDLAALDAATSHSIDAFVQGLTSVAKAPRSPSTCIEACLSRIRAELEDPRGRALEALVDAWGGLGAVDVWLDAVRDLARGDARLAFELAARRAAVGDLVGARRVIDETREKLGPDGMDIAWLDDVYDARDALDREEMALLLGETLIAYANDPRGLLIADLARRTWRIDALLVWCGGESALVEAARAVGDAATVLG